MTTAKRAASDAGQTETSSAARDVPLLTRHEADDAARIIDVSSLGDGARRHRLVTALRAIASGDSRVVPSRTGEGERERFEAWAIDHHLDIARARPPISSWHYAHRDTELSFVAWQAALKDKP